MAESVIWPLKPHVKCVSRQYHPVDPEDVLGSRWETFVPPEHALRAIRPLIEDAAIRRACRDLDSPIGRPSIPPEQVFPVLVGGYLLGITSERKLVSSPAPRRSLA